MPKQTLTVPDDVLLREVETLPAALKITEKQAALLIGCSAENLRWKRREQDKKIEAAAQGKPVAPVDLMPVQQGASGRAVRYKLGDVRRAMNSETHVGKSARDAAHARRQDGWMGFGSWLANASLEDTWTFTIVDGVPIDFTTSLVMADQQDWEEDSEQIEQLTLSNYLSMRLQAANLARTTREADEITLGTLDPAGEGVACPRCGKPHSGPCRF
jgi:hypothetical protein